MVNNFAIGLTHLLLALAVWRLVMRADLDAETPASRGDGDG
jgi:hypothetical protein